MDAAFPLEFYQELLKQAKQLSGKDNRISVRIHPTEADGGQKHWLRGTLTDISGNNLVILPLHGRQNQKFVGPEKVKLWESRMSTHVAKLVDKIRKDMQQKKAAADAAKQATVKPKETIPAKSVPVISNPLFEVQKTAVKPSPPKPIEAPKPPLPPEPKADDEMSDEELEKMTRPETPVAPPIPVEIAPAPVVRQPQQTSKSRAQILKERAEALERERLEREQELERINKELAAERPREILERLDGLRQDLTEAREMVKTIENDILAACGELQELEHDIPKEILDEMRAVPASPVETPLKATAKKVEEPTAPVIVPSRGANDDEPDGNNKEVLLKTKNNWCSGKAREYRPKIVEFFNKNDNMWASGTAILQYVGETVSSATNILHPLVYDDTLERIGKRPNVRYRLKVG